jgi:hypothetical protein
MDPVDVQALVTSLLLNISSIAGYHVPAERPEVHIVPAAQIQQRVCAKPCRARAFYTPDEGIYIDASLDLKYDFYDRSILVHELVHFMQHSSGRFSGEAPGCARYAAEETDAYDIQNKFLSQTEDPRRFAFLAPPGACDAAQHNRPPTIR